MGKIGEEITQKIKSAVKAKLIELGIEVDNELPDYIMVLVANKKSQLQMEKDLQLFLGSNTTLFTTWLLNVLKKLEEVTVSKKNYKRIEVTSQDGGVIVTKKEEDYDKRKALKLGQIKVEPGASPEPEPPGEESSQLVPFEVHNLKENLGEGSTSNDQEVNSTDDEETETNSKEDDGDDNESEAPKTLDQSLETEPISNDETSQDKPSRNEEDSDNEAADQGAESNDETSSETLETRERDESLDKEEHSNSTRPKIMYGIREQIDEVMEKTINGNRRPRRDSDKFIDDHDNEGTFIEKRGSFDDSTRFHDERRSVENEFYRDRRRLSADRPRFQNDFRRSSDSDRMRDSGRRSPDNRRRIYDNNRRSPDFRRRSPLPRRRESEYARRSPEFRRRSPIGRRRSPEERRRSRSPYDRRRSPFDRRRSPDDRRKMYSDRYKHDDFRRSPVDRGRARVMDAREILKRKSNRIKDVSPGANISNEESNKRRKVVASMVHKPEDNRERDRSAEPQIPSLVRVTPRPVRNEAIQPNKKLLLLAVADAEKSISRKPSSTSSSRKRELSRSEERKTTKRRTSESSATSGYVPPEKIFITLTNNKKNSDSNEGGNYVSREVSAKKLYDDAEITLEDELLYEESYFDYDQDDGDDDAYTPEDVYVPQPVTEKSIQTIKSKLSNEGKCIISLESSPERSCDEWEEMIKKVDQEKKSTESVSGEKGQITVDSNDEITAVRSDDGFEWNRLAPAPVAAVKPLAQGSVEEKYKGEAVHKALERCKYWPSCLSENCIYFHPSAVCKMFPHCKSGKECLFIHPDCKFGLTCLNPKCTYLHRDLDDKKKVVDIVSAPVLPVGKPTPQIKCAYFPNCKNLNCKFWHPVKNCKYGRTCARSDCYFFHPTLTIPPKELLTWTPKS